MEEEIRLGDLLNFKKTYRKFKIIMNKEKPTFTSKKACEYVDYALYVLKLDLQTPWEYFKNDLENPLNTHGNKSYVKSERARILGNACFKNGDMSKAHTLYTVSIAYAKPGSVDLALAYGNRSAVLFEKQYYKECLEDIKRALENNYPKEKAAKLQQREAKAKESLTTKKNVSYHDTIPTIENENPKIASASNCIGIKKNKKFGRHIVANRTINIGEILLVEKPYSSFLYPDDRTTHCSECLELCYNLIPCLKCGEMLYCSQECRKKAFIDYHRYECAILCHFGIDVIDWIATRATLKGIKEYGENRTDPDMYRSDKYKEISVLISHKTHEFDDLFIERVIGVAKVFYALGKYTDIFSEFDIDDKENILKDLLLNDAFRTLSNSAVITEHHGNFKIKLGHGLYSTLALFNHACSENVGHSFYGADVVLRACKKINKGEQCFINYGLNPGIVEASYRQQYLQNIYKFDCHCTACTLNWPLQHIELKDIEMFLFIQFAPFIEEIISTKIFDNHRRQFLLQKCLKLIEGLERTSPYLSYTFGNELLSKIFWKGNMYIEF